MTTKNLKLPAMVKYQDLQLGDKVEFFEGAYGTGTVYETNEAGDALVWRPFVKIDDYTTSGMTDKSLRVSPSLGIEQITLYGFNRTGTKTIKVLERIKHKLR